MQTSHFRNINLKICSFRSTWASRPASSIHNVRRITIPCQPRLSFDSFCPSIFLHLAAPRCKLIRIVRTRHRSTIRRRGINSNICRWLVWNATGPCHSSVNTRRWQINTLRQLKWVRHDCRLSFNFKQFSHFSIWTHIRPRTLSADWIMWQTYVNEFIMAAFTKNHMNARRSGMWSARQPILKWCVRECDGGDKRAANENARNVSAPSHRTSPWKKIWNMEKFSFLPTVLHWYARELLLLPVLAFSFFFFLASF